MTAAGSDFVPLLAGIGGLLVVATLIGQVLRRRAGDGLHPGIDNLNDRITAWWAMSVLLALAFLAGRTGVILLFAFCAFAALREFVTLTATRASDHSAIALAFFVILPLQFWLVWLDWYGLYTILIPVYACLLLPVITVLQGDTRNFLIRITQLQWALMICVYCASHVPALLSLTIPGHEGRNILLIAFLVVVVQLSDVLQYTWGKLLGRHRLAPSVSPSKTWEGLVGGVGSATLIGAALWWMTPFSVWQAGLMALVISLAGVCGGLVMSAIKRDRGVKDWGHLIAGHGGFIDRLDSVLFAAPIFFHLTRFFWSTT
jgi:phosphatidate cytidylyltransferase